ncbi:MAG: DNA-primase RepB domain-containing protein, partial [Ignisphaera sp.]
QKVMEYVSKLDMGTHVYFQVLPLAKKPEKGRGSERDVKVGRWLWTDLDYKNIVDKAEFEGCKELEDHALECYYREGDKWIHVKRPPLKSVISEVENRLGIEPTIVVDSGAGYHLYFRLSHEVDASILKKLESWLVDRLGGDPQAKDLARILRLPGTVNPRTQRLVKAVYQNSEEIDPEKLLERIESEKHKSPSERARFTKLRELSDSEILRIVDLLKDAYKPGYRQYLTLYLSGWLAKARISPLSAVKIVKHLYETTGDTDPLKTRLSTIIYSYKKVGIDVDEYTNDIESLTGVKPYGVDREISEEDVKGKTGLQEILETTLGEDRALAIIHELSEILQTLSPYEDSVAMILDFEKQIYALANLNKKIMVIAKKDSNGRSFIYKKYVAIVSPMKVTVYANPLGGITKYEVLFDGPRLTKPLSVGPATMEDIVSRVRAEGVVLNSKIFEDVLNAVIQAFILKGKAEIKTEIESPGFYWVENRIISVRYDIESIDIDRLSQALQLLNELAEIWFKHIQDKFSTIVKWGAIAPFGYILKQRGRWIPWLYLYGDSATGKTTLGRIVLKMWGLDSKHEKTGASIDTVARLGYVLSMSTFPVLVNEPGNALTKEEIVEMIKNAVENTIARGKYIRGSYTEIPALSCLIFTSNKFLPYDDALLRRFKVITFSYGEKIAIERQKEFKEKMELRLAILSEVGKCVAKFVIENLNILDKLDGRILLEKCYKIAGLEKPNWLDLEYTESPDPQETIIEEFIERFKKYINDLYARYVSRIIQTDTETLKITSISPDQVTLREKLKTLLEKHMIPGARATGDNVILTSIILSELGIGNKISLKSLAEILGCEYKNVKLYSKVLKGVEINIKKLIELLTS